MFGLGMEGQRSVERVLYSFRDARTGPAAQQVVYRLRRQASRLFEGGNGAEAFPKARLDVLRVHVDAHMTNPNVRSDNSDTVLKNRDGQEPDSESPDGRRIRQALHALGPDHDVSWLSRETKIPTSTIYDNLKRGIGKAELAVSLAAALGVSVDWLLTGLAPASDGSDHPAVTRDSALAERFGLKLIPEVDIAYSLGGGAIAEDYPDSRMVPFRQDWLDRLVRGFKADVFLTRGQGDSMMPTILDDDDVLVNRADNVIRQQDGSGRSAMASSA
jgi:hypothetical protein